jgi:hypothetical protein
VAILQPPQHARASTTTTTPSEHHYVEVTAKLTMKTDGSGTSISPQASGTRARGRRGHGGGGDGAQARPLSPQAAGNAIQPPQPSPPPPTAPAQVFHMRAITDPNAVLHHFLSAMHMHVALSHGPVPPPLGTGGGGGSSSGAGGGSFMGTGAFGGGSSSFGRPGAAASAVGSDPALADLKPVARSVYGTMRAILSERGGDDALDVGTISSRLPRHTADELHNALEELSVMGLVYDTGDAGWKFTSGN